MKVKELVETMDMKVLAGQVGLENEIQGGYTGDLLSFVMAHAKEKSIWITIQGHINSVAVASLLGLSAIILAEGINPDNEMLEKADEENIPILSTTLDSFKLVQELFKHSIL